MANLGQQRDFRRAQGHEHPTATVKDNRVELGKAWGEFGNYSLNTGDRFLTGKKLDEVGHVQ